MQGLAQGANKFLISHRLGADNVDRASETVILQRRQNDANNVVERDPTPILPTTGDPSTEPQMEGQ